MESNTFKSVTFGGFDKQDVILYIENAAKTHAEELRKLQEENDALRQENDSLNAQNTELTAKCEQLEARAKTLEANKQEQQSAYARLRQEADALTTEVDTLRTTARAIDALKTEVVSLRSDAEAYRQFRNRIGDIECEARRRTAELEETTRGTLLTLVTDFNTKYQELSNTFDVTSNYVTGELRKIDVMLSQLPRALDQLGADLNTLEGSLQIPEDQQ